MMSSSFKRSRSATNQPRHSKHIVSKDAFEDSQDVDQILDSAESAIFNISEKRLRGGFKHIDPILHHAFEELDKIASKPGSVTGVPSGLMDLDDMTSGFHPGELIIVAGRPGMGKTALALTMGRNAAILEKTGVGMFSLETVSYTHLTLPTKRIV